MLWKSTGKPVIIPDRYKFVAAPSIGWCVKRYKSTGKTIRFQHLFPYKKRYVADEYKDFTCDVYRELQSELNRIPSTKEIQERIKYYGMPEQHIPNLAQIGKHLLYGGLISQKNKRVNPDNTELENILNYCVQYDCFVLCDAKLFFPELNNYTSQKIYRTLHKLKREGKLPDYYIMFDSYNSRKYGEWERRQEKRRKKFGKAFTYK